MMDLPYFSLTLEIVQLWIYISIMIILYGGGKHYITFLHNNLWYVFWICCCEFHQFGLRDYILKIIMSNIEYIFSSLNIMIKVIIFYYFIDGYLCCRFLIFEISFQSIESSMKIISGQNIAYWYALIERLFGQRQHDILGNSRARAYDY